MTFHAGFLPHEESDPAFAKLLGRLAPIADLFAAKKMTIGLRNRPGEGGHPRGVPRQSSTAPNVGVNFDPANMILYDKGDPIDALRTLGPWVQAVSPQGRRAHQDARHLGRGSRGSARGRWTGALLPRHRRELGFTGDLCIEREAGNQRAADIRTAREYVETLVV